MPFQDTRGTKSHCIVQNGSKDLLYKEEQEVKVLCNTNGDNQKLKEVRGLIVGPQGRKRHSMDVRGAQVTM